MLGQPCERMRLWKYSLNSTHGPGKLVWWCGQRGFEVYEIWKDIPASINRFYGKRCVFTGMIGIVSNCFEVNTGLSQWLRWIHVSSMFTLMQRSKLGRLRLERVAFSRVLIVECLGRDFGRVYLRRKFKVSDEKCSINYSIKSIGYTLSIYWDERWGHRGCQFNQVYEMMFHWKRAPKNSSANESRRGTEDLIE